MFFYIIIYNFKSIRNFKFSCPCPIFMCSWQDKNISLILTCTACGMDIHPILLLNLNLLANRHPNKCSNNPEWHNNKVRLVEDAIILDSYADYSITGNWNVLSFAELFWIWVELEVVYYTGVWGFKRYTWVIVSFVSRCW